MRAVRQIEQRSSSMPLTKDQILINEMLDALIQLMEKQS